MSTRSGGQRGGATATTVRERASQRYGTGAGGADTREPSRAALDQAINAIQRYDGGVFRPVDGGRYLYTYASGGIREHVMTPRDIMARQRGIEKAQGERAPSRIKADLIAHAKSSIADYVSGEAFPRNTQKNALYARVTRAEIRRYRTGDYTMPAPGAAKPGESHAATIKRLELDQVRQHVWSISVRRFINRIHDTTTARAALDAADERTAQITRQLSAARRAQEEASQAKERARPLGFASAKAQSSNKAQAGDTGTRALAGMVAHGAYRNPIHVAIDAGRTVTVRQHGSEWTVRPESLRGGDAFRLHIARADGTGAPRIRTVTRDQLLRSQGAWQYVSEVYPRATRQRGSRAR